MKTKVGFAKQMLSVMLCFALLMTSVPSFMTLAAAGTGYAGGAGTTVSDLDSSTKYSLSLGDNASTEYAGRIWTDKSVYTGDITFATFGGGQSTVKLNENQNGEDFLVAYSALATSQSVSGQTQAPVDVVFVIDISGSMSNSDSEMDNGLSRIANTVAAVNTSMEKLMEMNEYTRIAVVTFSSTAEVLLPLDRYAKVTETGGVTHPYLSLNSTAAGGSVSLTARAEGTEGGTVNKTKSVSGGTNIQAGLYTGMNILASESDTTADVEGAQMTRIPSVILLSDGAPTYSSNSQNWWAPANNDNDGSGSDSYYGNGFKALMTGAYMKKAIDRNYGIVGTNYETTFYTIGMGISELENYARWGSWTYYTGDQDLAYFTLNPAGYWSNTNDMATAMRNAWDTYASGRNATVDTNGDETYTFRHPQTNDIYTSTDKDALKNLVDSYYDADNASAVNLVFEQIVANISISVPQVPTELKGSDPMTDGYITYTDPIGQYMEVKDVKAIIYAGQTFTAKTATTGIDGTVTYTFTGVVESAVYGHQEIKDILITVKTAADGSQILVIKIPASVIPLRVNTVALNADGSVKTHTNNGAYPARVIYSVGLQSDITKKSDDGVVYINRSKLSAAYLAANTNADGTINFYSNVYTGTNTVHGYTAGNATVEFEPSHTNGFYYILEDMPIYKDAQFTQQVTAAEGIDDDTVYYYKDVYYHGTSVEETPIERTGKQLTATAIKTGTDGYLYRAVGSPRLNRILRFEGTKERNATGTAQDFYAPTFEYAADGSAYDGKFVVYLGNNGRLTAVAGGDLQISKTVNAAPGLTAPDRAFEFTIDLNGTEVNKGPYDYVITDAAGVQISTGTVSENTPKIILKDGQTATVHGLPPGAPYLVTEAAAEGFTVASEGASGTITAGQVSVAKFTNTYHVDPVDFPTSGSLAGVKELAGRAWGANDAFTFLIMPYNDAPLPDGYAADVGVTVTQPDTAGGTTATFDFGTIPFTAPGVYRYTIMEKEPENHEYLPGMTYSRALYRLVVTVADDGKGTLSVTDYDIQKLYDDGAHPLFTYDANNQIVMNPGQEAQDEIRFVNTYAVDNVVRVPVALKDYTDNSGGKPLVSGMFEFKVEALGIVENGVIVDNDVSKVPMPDGSVNGVITTTNEGHNITFPSITFSQSHVPVSTGTITFRYRMSEVIPANPVPGMVYDTKDYVVDVVVSVDGSHQLSVNAIYPGTEEVAVFKNTYTPEAVSVDIEGSKTLNGRDMKTGESFAFELGANAATALAIRNGLVVVPSSTATVTGAKDGVAAPIAFEDITFKKPGTYVFTVSETAGTAPAVRYDDRMITVTVVVTDVNGKLQAAVSYSAAAAFTNTYTTRFDGTPVTLTGAKNLTGKSLLAGEFYFAVEERLNGTKIGEGLVTHTVDAVPDADGVYTGDITFLDARTYTEAGTYEYYITEQIPQQPVVGTTYDRGRFRYTVVVEDVDKVGKLTVTSTKLEKASGNGWANAAEIVFTNTYVPTSTTATIPLINKIVEGDRAAALQAGEFQFELKVDSAMPQDGIILPATTVVSNAANGNILFDEITFTKAGTYIVSVKEVIPADADKAPGITYSGESITAVYSVVDDRNGTLTATLTQFAGGDVIINKYTAAPGEAEITISKTFTGRKDDAWLSTDRFEFQIVAADEATKQAIADGKIEIQLDDGSETTATKDIDAKGKTVATTVKVNRIGTYTFAVSEIDGRIPGVAYDTTTHSVVIEATDDSQNAQIVVKVNGQNINKAAVSFANTYTATATAPVSFTAQKKVTPSAGNSFTLKGGEFSFVIEGAQGAPLPAQTTVSNNSAGQVDFGTVTFAQRGTYVYTVREVPGNRGGFTYDGSVYTITVEVTDDTATAQLVATTTVTDQNGNDASPVFDNKYNPKETSAVIFGAKELKSDHKTLEADAFAFTIKALTQGAPLPAATTVKNTATGTFQFDTITYTKVGTYQYEITEQDLGEKGYTYDGTTYTVTVTVTDEGDGLLKAAVDGVGTVDAPTIQFVNAYVPTSVDLVLGTKNELTKKLTGRDMKAEEFLFAVLDSEGNEIATTKNDKDGFFKFDLTFTKADTYRYTIVEKDNDVAGVTYDKKVYEVQIVIADQGGELAIDSVTYSLEKNKVDEVVFTNTYEPEDADVILSALKKLTGRALADGEFTFVLKDADGKTVATATNAKDGEIVFDKITFSKAGTYTYTVLEELGTAEHVTYDETEFIVAITVTDEGKGKLVAAEPVVKKLGSDAAVSGITFENVYTAPSTPEVPDSPQTGDNASLGLWFALLFISGGVLTGVTLCGKKRKESEAE